MAITPNYDLDIDTTLGGPNASDYVIPSQKAIKNYVDNHSGGGGSVDNSRLSYYGTCSTAAGTQAKVVDCTGFVLSTGVSVRVKFTNAQTYNGQPTLNVNSTGVINITLRGATAGIRYMWQAGEIVNFTYDGTNWIWERGGTATTSYYGVTALTTSATSTSTSRASTPASLNNLVLNMIAPYAVYSASATYAVGDRVRYNFQAWECNTAITTAEAWNADHWTALDPLQTQIDNKQDELISGTNIKTVNGNSLLGSGNITISGGATVTFRDWSS